VWKLVSYSPTRAYQAGLGHGGSLDGKWIASFEAVVILASGDPPGFSPLGLNAVH